MTMTEARAARDEGIARVTTAADPEWVERARAAVEQVASAHKVFTADEVWLTGLDRPREGRAMGAVMLWAVRQGLIRKTDRVRPSTIRSNHCKPQHIWESLVAEAAA